MSNTTIKNITVEKTDPIHPSDWVVVDDSQNLDSSSEPITSKILVSNFFRRKVTETLPVEWFDDGAVPPAAKAAISSANFNPTINLLLIERLKYLN